MIRRWIVVGWQRNCRYLRKGEEVIVYAEGALAGKTLGDEGHNIQETKIPHSGHLMIVRGIANNDGTLKCRSLNKLEMIRVSQYNSRRLQNLRRRHVTAGVPSEATEATPYQY
jgi:hypothetical protein